MKDIDRAESIKKRKEAQERKLLAEAKFDEWMKTRGMRKMELIGKMEEEPMEEVKESRVYDKEVRSCEYYNYGRNSSVQVASVLILTPLPPLRKSNS